MSEVERALEGAEGDIELVAQVQLIKRP
jgi:hypothetical protein